jgi:hypothetical protein
MGPVHTPFIHIHPLSSSISKAVTNHNPAIFSWFESHPSKMDNLGMVYFFMETPNIKYGFKNIG